MFTGAINATVRQFLGNVSDAFDGQQVVIGCSGNFTLESVICAYGKPAAVHSNDVSFYSCMIGQWLTGKSLDFRFSDSRFAWLDEHLQGEDDTHKLAAIMVLLDALEWQGQDNPHRIRMWRLYRETFAELVEKTADKLAQVDIKIASFYEGDVQEHFTRFAHCADAVFCCYAPTYAGGYERLYKRLDKIVTWTPPTYPLLTDERRDELLNWMQARRFVWYDDRLIDGLTPVMQARSGNRRMVYLYSNVIGQTAVFRDMAMRPLPELPLADSTLAIRPDSHIVLHRIGTSELAEYKNAYLNKHILFASGKWAFAVVIDGKVVGFLEFGTDPSSAIQLQDMTAMYMMADFPIPHTPYKRLSKLIVMLAVSGETRHVLERLRQYRLASVTTTAFTDKPVSMKYRGVFELAKRGEKDGKRFLNYRAEYNTLTWQETLQAWMKKNVSLNS